MDEFNPRHEEFDPDACWEVANCAYVEEECFGSIEDEDFEEFLYCGAPNGFLCPLHKKKVNRYLEM